MRGTNSAILLLTLVLIVFGCTAPEPLVQRNADITYDREAMPFNPEFLVYHSSADSSELHIKVDSRELLYTRTSPEAPFEARVEGNVIIERVEGLNSIAVDSLNFKITDTNASQSARLVVSKQSFQLGNGKYRFYIQLKDLNRRWDLNKYLEVEKLDRLTRADFMWIEANTGTPVFTNFLNANTSYQLYSARSEEDPGMQLWQAEENLPPPPYTSSMPQYPEAPAGKIFPFQLGKNQLDQENGMVSLYSAKGNLIATYSVQPAEFPEVETVVQMMESLRYISGRKEYQRIETSNYQKKEIDEFWLDCGGSKERTRDLIRIYYQRVEEANASFTSLIPGWKTDRGLIHVIFGNPNRIKRSSTGETWIYGEENNLSSVTFEFTRKGTDFEENHFILERNPLYRPDWDRAVTSWRNGRIFQE